MKDALGNITTSETITITVAESQPDISEPGSTITLTAVNGKYVSAANEGTTLIANKDTAGNFEKFEEAYHS